MFFSSRAALQRAGRRRRITRESLKAIEDETFDDNFKGEDTAGN